MAEDVMAEDTATIEFPEEIKTLGDQIAELNLKQAKSLSDYLKEEYDIEPAAGGVIAAMAPAGGDAGGAAAEQTEFDVMLTAAGDARTKVIKAVKALTGASLMDAKKLVDGIPAQIKEKVSKEDAEKVKTELEEAGGTVEIK